MLDALQHAHLLRLSVRFRERPLLRVSVRLRPVSLEIDGVHDDDPAEAVQVVDDLVDLSLRMVKDPVVDVPHRLRRKWRRIDFSAVIAHAFLQEAVLHRDLSLVVPDRVRVHIGRPLRFRDPPVERGEVAAVFRCPDPAEGLLHLAERRSLRPVHDDGHRRQDRIRREHDVAALARLHRFLQEAHGALIIGVHESTARLQRLRLIRLFHGGRAERLLLKSRVRKRLLRGYRLREEHERSDDARHRPFCCHHFTSHSFRPFSIGAVVFVQVFI